MSKQLFALALDHSQLWMESRALIASVALLSTLIARPAAAAQDSTPAAVPGGAYFLCFELASGGADHSQDPALSDFPIAATIQDNGTRSMSCRLLVAAQGIECDPSGGNCHPVDIDGAQPAS